jgi:hypothetical protein
VPIYPRACVSYLWLIDPKLQLLETYQREGERWLLLETFRGEAKVRAVPFDAIELELGAFGRAARRARSKAQGRLTRSRRAGIVTGCARWVVGNFR